ncbi:putative thiosulfate sulfurtransferase [Anopheles sinensis]|uniref:Putative thiosulfate sulfurtransferase n=1 Tax=Anopheles sinensis TaxID=74873 RepID=A0A084VV81_ANOSI|nr:putative thiosulfate sulfurtransferase [Anopheles sinensis]
MKVVDRQQSHKDFHIQTKFFEDPQHLDQLRLEQVYGVNSVPSEAPKATINCSTLLGGKMGGAKGDPGFNFTDAKQNHALTLPRVGRSDILDDIPEGQRESRKRHIPGTMFCTKTIIPNTAGLSREPNPLDILIPNPPIHGG